MTNDVYDYLLESEIIIWKDEYSLLQLADVSQRDCPVIININKEVTALVK